MIFFVLDRAEILSINRQNPRKDVGVIFPSFHKIGDLENSFVEKEILDLSKLKVYLANCQIRI